jgi:hypothetical protein
MEGVGYKIRRNTRKSLALNRKCIDLDLWFTMLVSHSHVIGHAEWSIERYRTLCQQLLDRTPRTSAIGDLDLVLDIRGSLSLLFYLFNFHSVTVLRFRIFTSVADRLRILSDLQRDELLALKRAPGAQDVPSCKLHCLPGFTTSRLHQNNCSVDG